MHILLLILFMFYVYTVNAFRYFLVNHHLKLSSILCSSSSSSRNDNNYAINNAKQPSLGFGKMNQQKIIPSIPTLENMRKEQEYSKLKKQYENINDRRVFDDTLQFPCQFTVKIIGSQDKDRLFINDVISSVASIIGVHPDTITFSVKDSKTSASTSASKYTSITIDANFNNSDELYSVYNLAKSDPRIKYII